MAMIAITTSSSIRVNPRDRRNTPTRRINMAPPWEEKNTSSRPEFTLTIIGRNMYSSHLSPGATMVKEKNDVLMRTFSGRLHEPAAPPITWQPSRLCCRVERIMIRLPIDAVLPELMAALRCARNAVLRAPTGAGKTTRVPPALLDAHPDSGRILLLEPRRLAARAAARRMAEERNCRV